MAVVNNTHRPRESKRTANRNRILNLLFREPRLSRLHLARRLNINASTVGNYIDDFLSQGILLEHHTGATRRGRSPVPVWLNPSYGHFLGIDLEALRVRTALVNFAGEVVAQREQPLRASLGPGAVLEIMARLASETAAIGGESPLLAVGLAAPGRLDFRGGRIAHYDLRPGFHDVPLVESLRPQFDCGIYMEENLRALTLAEHLRGAGQGHRNFLCLVSRSGVGMGIVIDGKIYTGHHALAGKLGQCTFPTDDGARTMTELVSATGIVRRAIVTLREAEPTSLRQTLLAKGDDLALADLVAAESDRIVDRLLERAGTEMGILAANLANIFAPEKIVLAGEVPTCSLRLRRAMAEAFARYTVPEILRGLVLADGHFSAFAGALGAAYLGFLRTFPEEELPTIDARHAALPARGA